MGIGNLRILVEGKLLIIGRGITRKLHRSYRLISDSILGMCRYDTYHAPFLNQNFLLQLGGVGIRRS